MHDEPVQRELEGLVWASPRVEPFWSMNPEGRIYVLSPWRLVDCWTWTREPDLDDFVITFFTSGPDTVTFPVKVYSMVRFSVTPEVNAASTVLIVLTVLLTAAALKLRGDPAAAAAGHGTGEKK